MAMRQPDQGRALTKEIYEGSQRIRQLEDKLVKEYPEFRAGGGASGIAAAAAGAGMKQTKMMDFTSSQQGQQGATGKGTKAKLYILSVSLKYFLVFQPCTTALGRPTAMV